MDEAEWPSAFDLDALREVFQKCARERGVSASDWAEYARLFLKQTTTREPGEEISRRVPGP